MRARVTLTIALALVAARDGQRRRPLRRPAGAGCSDVAGPEVAGNAATPWCSPTPARGLAPRATSCISRARRTAHSCGRSSRGRPGSRSSTRPTARHGRRAGSARSTVMLTGVHDVVLRGLTVRASAPQAIWIDDASRHPDRSRDGRQRRRGGRADQARHRGDDHALATDQQRARRAARHEPGAQAPMLSASLVSNNGHDGERYDGDGVELNSAGAAVTGNTITHNGDSAGFEHGIYAGRRGRRLRDHRKLRSAATPAPTSRRRAGPGSSQATASPRASSASCSRTIRRRHGAVQPHPGPLPARSAGDDGQHAPARARLWNNTVQQTGRSTASGNASAVFVASAAQLELRNNLISRTRTPTRSASPS